jgi:hypothetical protein
MLTGHPDLEAWFDMFDKIFQACQGPTSFIAYERGWVIFVEYSHVFLSGGSLMSSFIGTPCSNNEEPEELIRYAALMHKSVTTATSTEQWETSCLVNDAFGTTSWLFQDVSEVTFIVFHRVVRQRHLLR